jgi:hypothetical protein
MIKFTEFLEEQVLVESVRVGLPHITNMSHEQFDALTKDDKVHITKATEKTDGMTHVMGWDKDGFYTQSSGSGSEKMRRPEDFYERSQRRSRETGRPYDPTAPDAFARMHSILKNNKRLQEYLRNLHNNTGDDVRIRSEAFYRPMGRPSEDNPTEIKFVGTSYDPSHMGSVGKMVVHTALPDNAHVDPEWFNKTMSTSELNFDHDKVDVKPTHVDISKERNEFEKLDHNLLKARKTKSNKEAKEAEIAKFEDIKRRASKKVDDAVREMKLAPRWGTGTEGLVVHPPRENPDAPRFKVTSSAFREYKANPENQINFKKRYLNKNKREQDNAEVQ